LRNARARSDEIFALLQPAALYERPIAERHRIVFYLGHLETFDWNLIGTGLFGMRSFNPEFDRLFAFGIDPTNGNLPEDQPKDWPSIAQILDYNAKLRRAVNDCLMRASDDQLFWVAVEHRLMHVETLAYMFHWLSFEAKQAFKPVFENNPPYVRQQRIEIPAGNATLGLRRSEGEFGWDNEFDAHEVHVPAFMIDKYKVTNAEYAKFVAAGGYQNESFWSPQAWNWIRSANIQCPRFWRAVRYGWVCRTMFGNVPFQPSWPVYVSHAEAQAYARWRGRSLPTEAQFHRAAFGRRDGFEQQYPWGSEAPQRWHGNFDFQQWDPTPVDAHPDGDSAFGVSDLVGNGWEWTSTPFAPFEGFKAFDFYPGYSADFFDGNHFVLKGGSSRTAARLLRRSFRNWFQPLYPNIYASFRCTDN
jgi:ergothioneine biosynthesis protein EgtB